MRPDNEDHAFATYRFAAGPLVSHEMDMTEQAGTDRFGCEIFCAEATIRLRSERGPLALFAPGITGKREWVVPELPARPFGARHHADFLDRVRGKLPPDRTAEDGLATLLLAEAIYRSAASGRAERVVPVAESIAERE